ncbi:MAG TPA: protein kinase [Mycobacteriales bacterium]|jgi:serine/threonine-protein kinase|nr:protein kinase [Mycobacteriales bacterium]
MTATTGTVLGGRYRLDRLIATGGMGEVWRGHDEILGRAVAVKVMLPQLSRQPGFVERFRAEARHTAALSHPGIATVYDYGESEPAEGSGATSAYLVMELIEGQSLADLLESAGRLPADRTLDLVAQVSAALQAAHAAGVVHRDVKPANLLVRPDGTVVVTDFGIARSAGAASGLTMTGEVMGTAGYLAPEQAEGKPATAATDVYSLGVVAYQCLAGHRPFDGDTPVNIALAHLRDAPPPLPADVPAGARALVERTMAKSPADRYPSAAALAEAARAAATGQAPATPTVLGALAPTGLLPRPTNGPVPRAGVGRAAAGQAAVGTATVAAPVPAPRRRTPSPLVAGAAAGVVFALLLGLGITSLLTSGSRTDDVARPVTSPAAVTTSSPSPSRASGTVVAQTPVSPYLTLRAADYVGHPATTARAKLTALGLRVSEERQPGWRYRSGIVAAVSPTRVKRGGTVKLVVATGNSTGSGNSAGWQKRDKRNRDYGDDQGDDE